MLMPKRTKHRKTFRLPYEGKAKGNTELHFGSYGLMAKEGAWITANQIEAARINLLKQDKVKVKEILKYGLPLLKKEK